MRDKITEIYQRQVDTVYRVCLTYMRNKSDTEDCVSDTFVKLIRYSPDFNDSEHEKAWLIRTAANVCKNRLKHWWNKREELHDFNNYENSAASPKDNQDDIIEAVRALPEKYKTVIYLYYYEGYNSVQIANLVKKSQSTVRGYLVKARNILKERLGEDYEKQ